LIIQGKEDRKGWSNVTNGIIQEEKSHRIMQNQEERVDHRGQRAQPGLHRTKGKGQFEYRRVIESL
jgi:hypothetical protein